MRNDFFGEMAETGGVPLNASPVRRWAGVFGHRPFAFPKTSPAEGPWSGTARDRFDEPRSETRDTRSGPYGADWPPWTAIDQRRIDTRRKRNIDCNIMSHQIFPVIPRFRPPRRSWPQKGKATMKAPEGPTSDRP